MHSQQMSVVEIRHSPPDGGVTHHSFFLTGALLSQELVVDAHQHFWDITRFEYSWMTPELTILRRSFLPADLGPVVKQMGVDRTILVQAQHSLEEAHWLLELARANEFIAGVVTWADLTGPSLGKDLDEQQAHPKFKGVRHIVHDEPDDAWIVRPGVLAGLAELERRGIPYDLLFRPQHLKHALMIREHCPRLRMVVDHIAKPPIAQGKRMESWERDIATIAEDPEIYCKLSGMVTEADWSNWKPADLKPWVSFVVDRFGYNRVMFGSDWPVCLLAGTYDQVFNALVEALGPISEENRAKVFGGTARRFYRL